MNKIFKKSVMGIQRIYNVMREKDNNLVVEAIIYSNKSFKVEKEKETLNGQELEWDWQRI